MIEAEVKERNIKSFIVIKNCGGEEWLLGVYDDYNKAYGAIMLDAFKFYDEIRASIKPEESCTMSFDSRADSFSGAYMEIEVRYTETSYNADIEDRYRCFFEFEEG